MAALTKEQLAILRLKLEETLADIKDELKGVDGKVTDMGSDTDHFEEEEDEAEEFSINIAIAGGLKERRENVEVALQKMTEGKYGKCEKCGMDIGMDVLMVDPESRFCKHCKQL
ncbi:MAG: hypothetical protein HYV25_00965 [Candidatus Harrisonbacteria bacterium]|nr:hypothetical protein [Candidatus Harrisonbacteria bacterium]